MKRPLRGVLWITGSLILLLVATGLVYHRELAVAYHALRLANDPGFMLRLVESPHHSAGDRALSAYLETPAGRAHLRSVFVRQLLDHVTGPDVETTAAALDPAAWDQIELEVRRLHYEGASQEWWVVYAARDDRGRATSGSVPATSVLVALERRLTRAETGGAEAITAAGCPDMRFQIRPSEVEAGEWRALGLRRKDAAR